MPSRPVRWTRSVVAGPAELARPGTVSLGMIVSCCSLLGGCAVVGDAAYSAAFRIKLEDASKLSADELQQLQNVQLLSPDKGLAYASKGQVKGLACKLSVAPLIPVWVWRPVPSELNGKTPEELALTQLKIKAVKVGGNAVLSSACTHNDSLDWTNNCFETWVCVGEAVRVD